MVIAAFVASPIRNLGVVPAAAASSTEVSGGAEVAFQANTGELWTVGSAVSTADNVHLRPGTSPSIISLASGGDEVALQGSAASLWTVGGAGDSDWGLGMAAGTSPAIAALVGGGYEVAFEANTGALWTVGGAGDANWRLGMAAGTSPAIAALVGGGYEVAFEANTEELWTVGGAGDENWKLGMLQHASPSIVGVPETLRLRIIQAAQRQVGYQDNPAGTYCNYFTAYWGAGTACGNGDRSEEWCADFAAWVWRVAGVQVRYGSEVGELNGGAASFYQLSVRSGTWHPAGRGYLPQWGDMAVYGLNSSGTFADHVAVVTNFAPGNAGPNVVNGDWWSSNNGAVVAATDQTTANGTDTLSGYASP
jgi:hypothetical protein